MAELICDESTIEFPSNLACQLYGRTTEFPKTILGFGGRNTQVSKPSWTIEVFIGNRDDFSIFALWYLQELEVGTLPFLLDIEAYGVSREWLVKINNNSTIEEKLDSLSYAELKIDLILQEEDLENIIAESICEKLEEC